MFIEYNDYFRIKELEDLGIGAVFTLKNYGNTKEMEKENFSRDFNLGNRKIVSGYQVHSKNIKVIKDTDELYFDGTDGFITDRKDVAIFTKYADCLPVYLYDPVKEVIGLVHSGWKGTFQEIALEAVKLMEENYGSKRADIIIIFGIGISQKNYEVGEEFFHQFKEKFSEDKIEAAFLRKDGKLYFDNQKFNLLNLKANGIKENNIITNEFCTYGDERFHSFRRDKESSGRAGGFIYFK